MSVAVVCACSVPFSFSSVGRLDNRSQHNYLYVCAEEVTLCGLETLGGGGAFQMKPTRGTLILGIFV